MKQLGKYEVIDLIGKGAYAEVYRAVDTTLDRTVALKLLKPALLADEDAVVRFMREARTAANLIHPRIAWVWEVGELEGRYFIAVRYVDGQPLDQLLTTRGGLPWPEAREITHQIGEALSFAHDRGLVHRDVKPQNILISKTDGAVLTDFGLVRAMESSGVGTRTGVLMGTPAYMAPEIWRGENAGPAADQYALGCILCELLTGQQLFGAANTPAVILRHMQPPRLPEQWPADCSPNLSSTLGKALDSQPDQRFDSVANFVAMITSAEEPGPALASQLAPAGSQVEPAQSPPVPADGQKAPKPGKLKPIDPRVWAYQKSTAKTTREDKSPERPPAKPREPGHPSPYWPTLLWITLGWAPITLSVMDDYRLIDIGPLEDSYILSALYNAIAVGLAWTITGLALKKQYQLESRHIVKLLLLGIGSGILIGLFFGGLAFVIIGPVSSIISGIILRKHMHLTSWQIAGLGGGWILGVFFYAAFSILCGFGFSTSISGLIMGAVSGAIMITILEAARKRTARKNESN